MQTEKTFEFHEQDPRLPAQWWYQTSSDGLVLFVVFYTQACRWNRCIGCNLPSKSSAHAVAFRDVAAQIEALFALPEVVQRSDEIRKVIISNNGSVLDEETFASTALMYLMAHLNLHLPHLCVVSLESRVEYVDWEELVFLARALREREEPAQLELSVGFEAFDDTIRNEVFKKGLSREQFEQLVAMVGRYGFALKCYFMHKPVPDLSDAAAVQDIQQAIHWLDQLATRYKVPMNMHLNPTYVASGTPLELAFREGRYRPPRLADVAQAVLAARGKNLTVFVGLNDEGLAVEGGSFTGAAGDEQWVQRLEQFNRTQNFDLLLTGSKDAI